MLRKFCCIDLTLAARFISFLGLVISLTLVTVLLSDKFGNGYDNSRCLALALGLDWQHFHPSANATQEADPEGKLISCIVVVYSFLFLITNSILLFGTIMEIRWCAIVWIIFEIIGCGSKIGALIYHSISDNGTLTNTFLTGSIIYVVIISWFMLIVYTAQKTWHYQENLFGVALSNRHRDAADDNLLKTQNFDVLMPTLTYIQNERFDII